MPQVIESFHEFAARQGSKWILVKSKHVSGFGRSGSTGQTIIFQNGARSDGNVHYDPPADPKQLLLSKRDYIAEVLAQEEKEWKAYESYCYEAASIFRMNPKAVPGPPADCGQQLLRGKEKIEQLRAQLESMNHTIASWPENIRKAEKAQERERQQQEQRNRASALIGELTSIRI